MKRLIVIMVSLLPFAAFAQAERSEIRDGNKLYQSGDYKGAEVKYRSALQTNGDSYQAMSNLGSALFKQKLSADAQSIFQKVVEQSAEMEPQALAAAHYNLANSYLQERKLDEAIESYKNALRITPNDDMARFNLAYAQKLKKEDENKGGGGQNQNQNQNQDQNQDKNKDKNKKDEQQQQQQPKPESRQDADRILNALQDAENRTKEKVDKSKEKGAPVTGNKQW